MRKAEFLVITFLVAAFCSAQINVLPIEVALLADESRSYNLADYEVHDTILITCDDDFEYQGWPGNGTAEDPYVIEGLSIDASAGVGINIHDTTAHLIVRNCYVHDAWTTGIRILVSSNGLIEGNVVVDGADGIVAGAGGSNITVVNNTCMYNYEGMIVGGTNSTVVDNVCVFNIRQGMRVSSNGIKVINNNCSYNGVSRSGSVQGIYVSEYAENALIINNTCNGNGGDGSSAGIYFREVDAATVYNNTYNYNKWSGIRVYRGTPALIITNNTVVGNRWGIRTEGYYSGPITYDNEIGWNWEYNALDDVYEGCQWDNGVNFGNYWGDYNGTYPTYPILGSAGSVDNYPFKADTTTPVISFLDDFYYEAGSTGNYVNWTPSDEHPEAYQIFKNETPIDSGTWDGANISVSADGLDLGAYNFTLLVRDTCANSATSTVIVTVVDTTPPDIDNPDDVVYNEGETNNNIIWTPSDLYPAGYQILKDDFVISFGVWNSTGETLTILVDGLTLGVYNYTAAVIDTEGNSNTDTVFVNVLDGTPPTLDHPDDLEYDEGAIGNSIVWTPQDTYPTSYQILMNETLVKTGSWNSTLETISIAVDGLNPGVYNYTLVVHDAGGNFGADTVLVVVNDMTPPTINNPLDITHELGSVGVSIVWAPSDLYPDSWELYRDGTLINSGSWNSSSETMGVYLDGLEIGRYNYTIVVMDISGNSVSDTVLVTVIDTTSPTIDNPDDIQYESGTIGNDITWGTTDLDPDSYEVFRNGTQIDSGSWDGSDIEISIDGLTLGTHNFTLVVFDAGRNNVRDTVMVIVVDTTDPSLSTPEDIQFKFGDTSYNLAWMLQDMNPFSYEVFMNSTLIASGTWNSTGEIVTIALDGIPVGIHFLTIYVTDLAGNEASDMVIVTVLPDDTTTDTTTTSPPADSQFQIMGVLGLGIGFGVVLSVIVFVVLRKRE